MAAGKFVSYLRVSTTRQGISGLGLEAQRKTVSDFLNGGSWVVVAEFVEVESGESRRPPRASPCPGPLSCHRGSINCRERLPPHPVRVLPEQAARCWRGGTLLRPSPDRGADRALPAHSDGGGRRA